MCRSALENPREHTEEYQAQVFLTDWHGMARMLVDEDAVSC